jgi:hypothetical protein
MRCLNDGTITQTINQQATNLAQQRTGSSSSSSSSSHTIGQKPLAAVTTRNI